MSTLEAEYIALSQEMREIVSAHHLLLESCNRIEYDLSDMSQVYKAWENNAGTDNLANSKGPLRPPEPNTLE